MRFWKNSYFFLAQIKSSVRGLTPEIEVIAFSTVVQNPIDSKGRFNHPVVIQKYVSCGLTWWTRWCFRGRIMWWSCSQITQDGSPKYVCDHLWICKSPTSFHRKEGGGCTLETYLIRDSHEQNQPETVTVPNVVVHNARLASVKKTIAHVSKNRYGRCKIIAIRLNKVVPSDWCGIYVVLPERSDQCLKETQH